MSALLTHDEVALRDAAALAVELAVKRGATARASAQHEGMARIAVRGGEVETARSVAGRRG